MLDPARVGRDASRSADELSTAEQGARVPSRSEDGGLELWAAPPSTQEEPGRIKCITSQPPAKPGNEATARLGSTGLRRKLTGVRGFVAFASRLVDKDGLTVV